MLQLAKVAWTTISRIWWGRKGATEYGFIDWSTTICLQRDALSINYLRQFGNVSSYTLQLAKTSWSTLSEVVATNTHCTWSHLRYTCAQCVGAEELPIILAIHSICEALQDTRMHTRTYARTHGHTHHGGCPCPGPGGAGQLHSVSWPGTFQCHFLAQSGNAAPPGQTPSTGKGRENVLQSHWHSCFKGQKHTSPVVLTTWAACTGLAYTWSVDVWVCKWGVGVYVRYGCVCEVWVCVWGVCVCEVWVCKWGVGVCEVWVCKWGVGVYVR